MTREEARVDLMLAQADIHYRPKDDSIDMAIEALVNQKTGHWINRHNIYMLIKLLIQKYVRSANMSIVMMPKQE